MAGGTNKAIGPGLRTLKSRSKELRNTFFGCNFLQLYTAEPHGAVVERMKIFAMQRELSRWRPSANSGTVRPLGKWEASMLRELQFLAVGCVFVFLGAIVVGIF